MSNKGVPMSLDEFYQEVVDSVICGIVESKVISPVCFWGDPSDGSCDMRRQVWFRSSDESSSVGIWRISQKDSWFSAYGIHGDYKLGLMSCQTRHGSFCAMFQLPTLCSLYWGSSLLDPSDVFCIPYTLEGGSGLLDPRWQSVDC